MAVGPSLSWENFDKLHVIRRLRRLLGDWWKIQLNFTDEKGFIRGVPEGRFFNPINGACRKITAENAGFRGCLATVRSATAGSFCSSQAEISVCHMGFSTITVPIRIDDKYLGCAFADGFVLAESEAQQKAALRSQLTAKLGGEDVEPYLEALPVLTEREVRYLTQLIEIIVEEILAAHSALSDAQGEVTSLKSQLGARFGLGNIIGKSPQMEGLFRLIERAADATSLVLIHGENGTGKELIAKALHHNSPRHKKKFIPVNCGALNEGLLESELFGHVKGAFTGASKDKVGLFEAAAGGTLFLDEIGDTTLAMQVKLLRILQEGTYTPVGATETRQSTARVVCATNRDLAAMVAAGEFREDLFYRLNVITLDVPALRERKEDIPLLVEHFLGRFPGKAVAADTMAALMNYSWPGNIRELENELERLCVLAGEEKSLGRELLSPRIRRDENVRYLPTPGSGRLRDAVEELERTMILEGLRRTGWNKSKLARELGVSRAGLILKVEKYGLEKQDAS